MAKPVWQQKLQAQLDANPLYHDPGKDNYRCTCKACGGSGKRVSVRSVVNYGRTFDHCYKCARVYR